jgi:electron transport complex protein RnfG
MREFFRLVGTLTLISMISAGALSYTFRLTQPVIEANRLQKKLAAIASVLPPFDNQPDQDSIIIPNSKGERVEFYLAQKDGKPVGVAFQSMIQGYSSKIAIMMGVTPDGKIYGIDILNQNETPGLGNKVANESFTRQFDGKGLSSVRWDVKKYNGDFDQVTAATVSSRTVIRGIKEGLAFYQSHKEEISKSH